MATKRPRHAVHWSLIKANFYAEISQHNHLINVKACNKTESLHLPTLLPPSPDQEETPRVSGNDVLTAPDPCHFHAITFRATDLPPPPVTSSSSSGPTLNTSPVSIVVSLATPQGAKLEQDLIKA